MLSCSIDLSNLCQNSCKFCLSRPNLNGELLDLEIYNILLSDLYKMGVESIVFSGGGEPLTHPDFRDFVLSASAYGFRLGMITNGIDLDKYFDLIPNFVFIKVSLDAGTRKTYLKVKGSDSFNKVIQNIIRTVDKTFINVGFILTEENAHEVFDIGHLLNEAGTISINKDVCKFPRKPTLESCKISENLGIVTADACVYYCSLKRWDKDFLLGNLKDNNIIDIWERRSSINPDITKCTDCRYSITKHEGFV